MATISSPGIGSGLDINSIVTQLVAVEKIPLTKLQTEASSLQTRLSTYGKVQSAVSALRDAASALTKSSTWAQTTGTSSDPAAVSVTTSATTPAGQYAVQVNALASMQSNVTGTYPSADSIVGEGTLNIQLGAWGAGNSFTPKAGSGSIAITVGPPPESLAQLRDKINAGAAGVTASVVTDATGARLVIRSSSTGASNGFKLTVNDTDGNNSDGLGLSALAFDPSAGILTMAQALAAANASATINGVAISAETNSLPDVIDGLSLTLNKVTTAPVQLSAAQDTPTIRKAVDSFVTAYNDLNKLLADQTKYDPNNKKTNNLQGDSAAISMRTQMRNVLGQTSAASSVFTRLADVGFDVQTDGSIKVNDAKIASGLANRVEIQKLFGNADLVVPGNEGIATRLRKMADGVLGTDGTLSNRTDGLRKRLDLNQDRQDSLSLRIEQIEKRLRAQYTALDRQMGQLSGLSGYVTQQMNMLTRSSTN